MNEWSKMSTYDLKARLKSELALESPNRNTINAIVAEMEERDPVKDIPVEVVVRWNEIKASRERKAKRIFLSWKSAVAALITVVLLGLIPGALGAGNIFVTMGQWTKDIFSFGGTTSEEFSFCTDHPGLQEMYNTITELGVTQKVVPAWLPDGYDLEDITQQLTPRGTNVYAIFADEDSRIQFKINICNEIRDIAYQKNEDQVELREYEGITTYIVVNKENCCAMWQTENVECAIYADTKEIIYKILESIYEE